MSLTFRRILLLGLGWHADDNMSADTIRPRVACRRYYGGSYYRASGGQPSVIGWHADGPTAAASKSPRNHQWTNLRWSTGVSLWWPASGAARGPPLDRKMLAIWDTMVVRVEGSRNLLSREDLYGGVSRMCCLLCFGR